MSASSSSTPPAAPEWVAVGEIVGIFGISGDIKVRPLTDFPQRFASTPTLYLGPDYTPYQVASARQHKTLVVLHLVGLDDPTLAERLAGRILYIPEDELLPLEPDQFYIHDAIGMRVEHVNGQLLGTVRDVLSAGGNDLFVIESAQTGQDVYLPIVKEFITRMDLAARLVQVHPIPGLFDEQADEAR